MFENEQIEVIKCGVSGRECFRCRWFSAYFTRGVKEFSKTKHGWCCKFKNHVETRNSCDAFEKKPFSKKSKYFIKICLNNMLTEIVELHNVIKTLDEGQE